jgi:hypothetical protein
MNWMLHVSRIVPLNQLYDYAGQGLSGMGGRLLPNQRAIHVALSRCLVCRLILDKQSKAN